MSTFTVVVIPLAKHDVQMNRNAPLLAMGSGEIVLLVEDDRTLRRMAGLQLRSLGYKVLEAEDGQAALRILQSEGQVDLLLTDVVLGKMSGIDLGREARQLRPDLKLMYMSGYPRARPDDRYPLEGDVILLRKPFLRKEIAVSVSKALNAR